MASTVYSPRDLLLARRIKKYVRPTGFTALRIVLEARRAGLPVSLACALVEQESGFANVFGHDAVRNPVKGGPVDLTRYRQYKHYRDIGWGCNGVGPAQLTSKGFQDAADKLGGCHIPRHNLRIGFQFLAGNVRRYGRHIGIASYNAGPANWKAGEAYARSVEALAKKWHERLA